MVDIYRIHNLLLFPPTRTSIFSFRRSLVHAFILNNPHAVLNNMITSYHKLEVLYTSVYSSIPRRELRLCQSITDPRQLSPLPLTHNFAY
jgi:hypothetical protein